MNSSLLGYVLFFIAAYVLLVLGADVTLVESIQSRYVARSLVHYVHVPGLVFVVLGVLASTLISYQFKEIGKAIRSLYFVYFHNKIDFQHYIDSIVDIAKYLQTHDIESLEEYANQLSYPFLREGLLLLVNGYKKEDVHEILGAKLENETHREQIDDDVFRSMAGYSPGFGMLGTTVGLIQMFSAKIDAASGFGPILAGLAVAFTTTLYGLILSNFIFQPFADKVERRTEDEMILKTMLIDGLLLVQEKRHPIYIQDKLSTYVPHSRSLKTGKVVTLGAQKA
mgnify:CR=1 FL=1